MLPDSFIFVQTMNLMSVEEKWKRLGSDDQLFVEQIINQLLELKEFTLDEKEYNANMDKLNKMKEEPGQYSRDAFQVIRDLKAKFQNEQG